MSRRVLIMVIATALAVVVVLLTLLVNTPKPRHVTPPDVVTTAPNWQSSIDPGKASDPHDPMSSVGKSSEITVIHTDEKGHQFEFRGNPVTPLPGGWFDVGDPVAIEHLSPLRVIDLRALAGKFYAPQQQPRRGDLRGHVRIDVYDTPAGQKPQQTPDSPDNKLRMYMDQSHFDLDLCQVDTDGPVHLTAPQFDFVGREMRMTYNQPQHRMEMLVVKQARWLRISTHQPASQSATQPATQAASRPAATEPAGPVQFYLATFNHNVHIQQSKVEADADRLTLVFSMSHGGKGGKLGLGPAGPGNFEAGGVTQIPAAEPMMVVSSVAGPLGVALTRATRSLLAVTPEAAKFAAPPAGKIEGEPTMAPPMPDDLTITWTGEMTVVPLSQEQTPRGLAGADDYLLALEGAPLHIVTPRGETIESVRADYMASTGLIHVLGSPNIPLRIDSRKMGGVLTAKNLYIDQSKAIGRIDGPGTIKAYGEPGVLEAITPQRELMGKSQRLPRGFSVTWDNALDLSFYMDKPWSTKGPGKHEPFQAKAIKTATFNGQVKVKDPQFDLDSDQLALALDPPITDAKAPKATQPDKEAHTHQVLRTIDALGHVHSLARGKEPKNQMQMDADALTINLDQDEAGKLQAQRLVARRNVVTHFNEGVLHTQFLDVALSPREKAGGDEEPGATSRPGTGRPGGMEVVRVAPTHNPAASRPVSTDPFADTWIPANVAAMVATGPASQPARTKSPIRELLADGGVQIDLDDPPRHIHADRFTAVTATDAYDFFGTAERQVRVESQGATIIAPHVVMARDGKTLDVPEPGTFEFVSTERAPARGVAAKPVPAKPVAPKPPMHVTVTWKGTMHLDSLANFAQFNDDVKSVSLQGLDSSKLTCQDLRLDFIHFDDKGLEAEPDKTGGKDDDQTRGLHHVRQAVAKKDVVFEAQSADPAGGARPLTRTRIIGPIMTFDGTDEEVRVPGAGALSMEDHRPKAKASSAPAAAPAQPGGLDDMSGRGDTAIRWTGRLLINHLRNEMIVDDGVQLLHVPEGSKDTLQIDCQHLAADLHQTEGVGTITHAPSDTKISAFYADGNVRVTTKDRVATTDHLEYTAADNVVFLLADKGRMSQVTEGTQNPVVAQAFRWDRMTNRMEVIDPGRAVMPMKNK